MRTLAALLLLAATPAATSWASSCAKLETLTDLDSLPAALCANIASRSGTAPQVAAAKAPNERDGKSVAPAPSTPPAPAPKAPPRKEGSERKPAPPAHLFM